jgi:hypothetical protein
MSHEWSAQGGFFTQAQGANFHCQPTARQLTHTQMLDCLADHLPAGSRVEDVK